MFQETITLVLKHADISTEIDDITASSNAGSWTNGKQTTTFNINLINLLGEQMYNKNDFFVLRLNQIGYSAVNYALSDVYDTNLEINLSGLNFVNSTYDVKTGTNGNRYKACLVRIPPNTGGVLNLSPNVSICNFKKSTPNIQLTIELNRLIDGLPAQYGAVDLFPHMAYSFDIYPIKK